MLFMLFTRTYLLFYIFHFLYKLALSNLGQGDVEEKSKIKDWHLFLRGIAI